MNRIWNALSSFFGGNHRYRRYGGYGVAAAPFAYGIARWLRGRRANAPAAAYAGPSMR